MTLRRMICAIFFGLWILPGAQGQDSLHIAYDENFPPYTMQLADQQPGGLFIEILHGALENNNITTTFDAKPWKRVIHMTQMGTVSASLPWRPNPQRFKDYLLVGPLTLTGNNTVLWTLADNTMSDWTELSQLKAYKIGKIDGYAYPALFDQAADLQKIAINGDNDTLLKHLLKKRVDLIIGDEVVLAAEANKMGLRFKFRQIGPAIENVKRYVAVPKNKPAIAQLIEEALHAFHKTPQYQDIIARYQ